MRYRLPKFVPFIILLVFLLFLLSLFYSPLVDTLLFTFSVRGLLTVLVVLSGY